jgi:competence protein ComFC
VKPHLSAFFYNGLWTALDWIFPPECAACGMPGYRVCLNCQNKINFISYEKALHENEGQLDKSQIGSGQRFVPAACADSRHLAFYEGVLRKCVHSLKYHENRGLGELFARWLAALVSQAGWRVDLVIPIPLSQQRFQARGYNQAALVAKPLAARMAAPYNPYGLRRILDTPSQVGLSAEARRMNVARAFYAESAIVRLRSVLLVDDVMTTGSTLSACAKALSAAGALAVFAVTVGRHIDINHSEISIHHPV